MEIRDARMSRFFSPFLNSPNSVRVTYSLFSKFLGNCLVFDDKDPIRDQKFTQRQEYKRDSVIIENSKFINMFSGNLNGSAIYHTVTLIISNCLFQNCYGYLGGAISSKGSLNISLSSFINCSAVTNSGAIDIRSSTASTIFLFTLFHQVSARLFGCLYRFSSGGFPVENTNFSSCLAKDCVGTIENSRGSNIYKYTVFSHCGANVHNGCIVLRDLDAFEIFKCHFIKCFHVSSEQVAGAAILLYKAPQESTIRSSSFFECSHSNSYTISMNQGNPTMIIECCFSGTKEKEIRSDPVAIEVDNIFQGKCSEPKRINGIGFGQPVKKTRKLDPIWIKRITAFLLSFGVTVGVFQLFGILFPKTYRSLIRNTKEEKQML